MTNKAVRGLFFVILGCCLANIALVAKMTVATSDRYHRSDAVVDFAKIERKLDVLEWRQTLLVKRQAVAMKALKIDLVEPATQP